MNLGVAGRPRTQAYIAYSTGYAPEAKILITPKHNATIQERMHASRNSFVLRTTALQISHLKLLDTYNCTCF